MKNLVTRCIASVCMAAGALAAAPAQAYDAGNINCDSSKVTKNKTNNPGYLDCSGPFGPDTISNHGLLDGGESADLKIIFGGRSEVSTTIPFTYFGKSNDTPDNGPFTSNPGTPAGVLTFDPSISVLGTVFVLGFESASLNNYSYYLFDSRTFPTLSVAFDTLGITDKDGGQPNLGVTGPNLAFAGLYVQVLPTGGTVPEPADIALIAAAFGALALTTRRRRG